HPLHVQQRSCAAEERFFVGIEADSPMAKKTADVEEISCAASEIQNAERLGAIEPEILGALNVDADPVGWVFVHIDFSRIGPVGIMFAQTCEFRAIKCRQDPAQ